MSEENSLPLELASKCFVYEGVDPASIRIRTLRGKDQMIIAETTYDNFERKVTSMLGNVLQGITPEKLTLGDRLHALLWLTINSRKKDYLIENITCGSCWTRFSCEVDLSMLEVIELPEGFKEPYPITLSNGQSIGLRLFRVRDEIEIADYERKGKSPFIYRYALSVVDDKMNILDKVFLLENLPAVDFDKIRAFHERFFHGPKLEAEYSCPECGGTGRVPVPFRLEMLFPSGEELARHFGDAVPAHVSNEPSAVRDAGHGSEGAGVDVQPVSEGKEG